MADSPTPAEDAALDLVGTWVRVLSLRTRLLSWYDRAKRDLPWRLDTDPYRVLVSELMLQQTRVDVVVPFYERWTARWPDFAALAAAHEDEVLAAWSGLGYYRRARALHAVARIVTGDHGGELPDEPARLRELPGIGEYTAHAVASIAFGREVPVVDGNVVRVMTRLLCDQREPGAARRRTVTEAARRLVTGLVDEDPDAIAPPDGLRPGDWNQAVMELGATVCVPAEPNCLACPWVRSCLGNRAGLAAGLPRRKPKTPPRDVTLHMAVVRREDEILLLRRPEGALLSGLWELPTTEEDGTPGDLTDLLEARIGSVELCEPARKFRHTITNRRIMVYVHEVATGCVAEGTDDAVWTAPDDLADYGVSSMTRKALR